MTPNRRKPADHEVVMAVISAMNRFGFVAAVTLCLCLVGCVGAGIFGHWELAVVTALIAAVSNIIGNATGFMAGVLSQTKGAPIEPVKVQTEPGKPLETTLDVTDTTPDMTDTTPPKPRGTLSKATVRDVPTPKIEVEPNE